ncbi:hypothetical protein [Paenibacillus harenae]|uniref:hypothetical protein n=1 Tax=Paenibacillus harenae TaxID=306543 RepID=UPI0004202A6C|nr:hypothetical protein [Paenibacillus harenae]
MLQNAEAHAASLKDAHPSEVQRGRRLIARTDPILLNAPGGKGALPAVKSAYTGNKKGPSFQVDNLPDAPSYPFAVSDFMLPTLILNVHK